MNASLSVTEAVVRRAKLPEIRHWVWPSHTGEKEDAETETSRGGDGQMDRKEREEETNERFQGKRPVLFLFLHFPGLNWTP